ncbi:MAG: hypothetical protein Q9207_006634 [Kuettlingeria erythrocarpa]
MSCQRRVWRYTTCQHEEVMDLNCSLGNDPNHVHNTIVIDSPNPPTCTICNSPPPPNVYQARNLAQNRPRTYLGAPWSNEVAYRGTDWQGPPSSAGNEAAVNGQSLNGATGRGGPRRIDDNTANLPWAVQAQHDHARASVPSAMGGPVLPPWAPSPAPPIRASSSQAPSAQAPPNQDLTAQAPSVQPPQGQPDCQQDSYNEDGGRGQLGATRGQQH